MEPVLPSLILLLFGQKERFYLLSGSCQWYLKEEKRFLIIYKISYCLFGDSVILVEDSDSSSSFVFLEIPFCCRFGKNLLQNYLCILKRSMVYYYKLLFCNYLCIVEADIFECLKVFVIF